MDTEQSAGLVQRVQSGDTDAFGLLYDAYLPRLFAFVYYKTQHRQTTEDIVSQAFTKALQDIRSFSSSRGTFQSWIFQIARNLVTDHFRSRHHAPLEDAWELGHASTMERDADTKFKLAQVEDLLKQLTAKEREVILLRLWQDMSYRDIAEAVSGTEASCKMLYARGVKKLRDHLPALLILLPLLRFPLS